MSSRKGLWSNAWQPAYLITPCPAVIDQYFTEQMHYCKLTPKANSNAFIAMYSKTLSHKDNPMFDDLAGEQYISYIIVDLFNGALIDCYFEIRDNKKRFNRVWQPIRSYNELTAAIGSNQSIEWLFKWHLNIVHMTREYLKGGWLYRSKRQKELEVTKDKYVILNKKGFTNILENAKPNNVEFLGNGKVK